MKKVVMGLFIFLALLIAVVSSGNDDNKQTEPASNNKPVTVEPAKPDPKPEPKPEPVVTTTLGERNALKSAKNYLSFSAFSYKGLIKQLEFEGFSNQEAVYAVDNVGADWNEQAAKSAENYLSFSSFSRDGLIKQLEFEGFTRSEAEYGVKAVGY